MIEERDLQFPWSFEFESIDQVERYFLNVYASNHPSLAEQMIVLAALMSCIYSCTCLPMQRGQLDDLRTQEKLCQSSLEKAIASLPFHLPATFDYVLALAMAVSVYPD